MKDRAVIVVDASNLSFGAHNDVWKGDREHIRKTNKGERYQAAVTKAIRQSRRSVFCSFATMRRCSSSVIAS